MNTVRELAIQVVQAAEPEPGRVYSLDTVAYLTGLSRRAVLLYRRSGVIEPATGSDPDALVFDETAVHKLRQAERLCRDGGMSRTGVKLVFDLVRELELLEQELRFYRGF